MHDWQALIRKRDFPMIENAQCRGKTVVYLDNAATTQASRPVIWTMENYYMRQHANVHRGVYCMSEEATAAMEETRQLVAEFIGAASPDEVVFTSGTTQSINFLAEAFAASVLKPGDLVLATEMEHNSNLLPWLSACSRSGAELALVPVTADGELDLEELGRLLEKKPKLLAVCAVSNVLGTVNPLREIAEMAHAAGAAVAVDAAQAMRHGLPGVCSLGCDFLSFSAHKIMGPTGSGILYGKREWLERLAPPHTGGGMVSSMQWPEINYEDIPLKFEAGTPNLAGIAGFGAAIEYIQALGRERISEYEVSLIKYAEKRLSGIPGIQILGSPAQRFGALSFTVPPLQAYDVALMLSAEGFALRSGRHCANLLHEKMSVSASVRLSPAFYNTKNEIELLAAALERLLAAAKKAGVPVGGAKNG